MKINEKNLAVFATSATPIDREGSLIKRGEVNKAYAKRWFVLKGNLLFYFEKRGDKEPIGVIILEGCTIELAEDEEQFGFKIVFHGAGNRSYVMAAESQESMEGWMKALACAGYDFMKLMVAELQRQLDDLEECSPIPGGLACDQPLAPPRQRHNPFNRLSDDMVPIGGSPHGFPTSQSASHLHQRSQSMRVPGNNTKTFNGVPRLRITFYDLHNAYGRKLDRSKYGFPNSKLELREDEMLITF